MALFKAITNCTVIAVSGLLTALTPSNNITHKTADKKGFAVIELFTSEGCSSCPPADALVAKIAKEDKDMPVYILAYHVDYWNRLGWKDVFSSSDYSKRQRDYAGYLHISSVYTPQIVVNGKKEFVGSEEGTLRNAIKSGLDQTAAAKVMLDNLVVDGNTAKIGYQTTGVPKSSNLVLALIQKNAQTDVKAGENGGRKLSHVQIVRKLQVINLAGHFSGTASFSLPANFKPEEWEITALVQETNGGAITGAGKIDFNKTGS